jgi:predicted nucleotidyltransferase
MEKMQSNAKTTAMPAIVIQPHEWEELSAILQKKLPGRKVWAFGSRATGRRVKRFSDLDLAIEGKEMTLREAAMLDEALDESRLPFKVDVVELDRLAPAFRAAIEPDLVLLLEPVPMRRAG